MSVCDADARAAPLVLDGQRSATPTRQWCERGSETIRYLTENGYVQPRCKRRDCPRCWALRSRETARCLVLDARTSMPTVCVTLTTHDPSTTAAIYRLGSADLWRRLRRLYGRVEYFGAIEFTTGKGERSGGHRRLHGHYLVKGLDPRDVLNVEGLAIETWKRVTGAWRVEVAALMSPGAALGYLGLHHRKPEQAPPPGWRGMTERASQGYWSPPGVEALRVQARSELAAEAIAWRTGVSIELAMLEVAARPPARLREVRSVAGRLALEPMGEPSWDRDECR